MSTDKDSKIRYNSGRTRTASSVGNTVVQEHYTLFSDTVIHQYHFQGHILHSSIKFLRFDMTKTILILICFKEVTCFINYKFYFYCLWLHKGTLFAGSAIFLWKLDFELTAFKMESEGNMWNTSTIENGFIHISGLISFAKLCLKWL
jgi:hypothetical protein